MKDYYELGKCQARPGQFRTDLCDDCSNDCESCLKEPDVLYCEGGECGESCPFDKEDDFTELEFGGGDDYPKDL
jgi:hypothetical protein